jgi:hypothetical protein
MSKWIKTHRGWENDSWVITSRKKPTVSGYDPDYPYSLFHKETDGSLKLKEVSTGLTFLQIYADWLDKPR